MAQSKLCDAQLQKAFERANESVDRAIHEMDWKDPLQYGCFLAQTYHITKHTTRVAALTAGGIPLHLNELHQRALVHVREESGHEFLALRDLKNLGYELNHFEESIEAKLMLQSQYHFIAASPFSHFGFVLVLERIAAEGGPALVRSVDDSHGKSTSSFLSVHSTVDQGHVLEMIQMINGCPNESYGLMKDNIEQTGHLYSEMLVNISKGNYLSETRESEAA